MKKFWLIFLPLVLTACLGTPSNYYEPVKLRRTVVMVSLESGHAPPNSSSYDLWRKWDNHPPATWHGKTYDYCGYFAAYASQAEAKGIKKLEGNTPTNAMRLYSYHAATLALTISPECHRNETVTAADGNLMASVNLVRTVASEIPPEVENMGSEAVKAYKTGILNRMTAEEFLPVIADGRFATYIAIRQKIADLGNRYGKLIADFSH